MSDIYGMQKQPSKLWVLGSNPNGITKRQPHGCRFAIMAFHALGGYPPKPPASLRSEGASIQRRCFSRLLDHRRPFYARELAPRRARDAGAQRRNPNIANPLHILRKKCVSSHKPTALTYVSIPFTTDPDRRGDFNGILFFRPWQPGVVFPV